MQQSQTCLQSAGDNASQLADDLLQAALEEESAELDAVATPDSGVNLKDVSPSTGP